GHDAGAVVLRDGRLASIVLRERLSRVKHAMSLDRATIERALADAGVSAAEIDACAICSTQLTELIVQERGYLTIELAPHADHERPGYFAELLATSRVDVRTLLRGSAASLLYDKPADYPRERHAVSRYFPEYRHIARDQLFELGWLDTYVTLDPWKRRAGLAELATSDLRACVETDASRFGFHYPVTVRLGGRALPGYFINHHLAHAASAYYPAPFESAAILTHDRFSSGATYHGGMFYFAAGHRLFPLTPHHLVLGSIYEETAVALNLGISDAAGKLMGLAPYGKPAFHDARFVGNWNDLNARGLTNAHENWLSHCGAAGRSGGYDMSAFRDTARMTAPFNADVAASTQLMFEETMRAAVTAFRGCLEASGLATNALCLSGGTALNCPANSAIFRSGDFARLFVPPWCDDSGLAAGAALALYHSILDQPLPSAAVRSANASPYHGSSNPAASAAEVLRASSGDYVIERPGDWAASAAAELAADRVIAWFEGRSEIGPRALGHRSLLADPRQRANWARVNEIKRRESWRPFAPAVLAETAADWFEGAPDPSPYMLFTAVVKRPDAVAAIAHVDGSARLQTVDAQCGDFRRLLESFAARTGVPVLLNTSFNGPGEPIVETVHDALRFLSSTALDTLYIEGWRVTRR
ncbi:MAG: carbamoyltransferase, partial [Alphaproteobacteria bacterium]|nr:carbamoyltransferase [Alphaproteobacteria bacterium]